MVEEEDEEEEEELMLVLVVVLLSNETVVEEVLSVPLWVVIEELAVVTVPLLLAVVEGELFVVSDVEDVPV